MKRALAAVDGWWMAPAPPERLAVVRLLVGTYALVFLLIRAPHLMGYAHYDRAFFDPVGIVSVVLPRPLLPLVVQGLVVASLIFAVAFVLGYRHRITGPIFAGLLLWVLTYAYSWGKILHTDNMLVLYVAVLGLTRSADALSLDARRGGSVPAAGDPHGWPLKLMCALCIGAYLLAGVAKVRNSGMEFVMGDTLRNYIGFDNVRKIELGSIHSPLGAWLLPFERLWTVLAAGSVVLELGAPLALVHRRVGVWWCVAIWGFHVGVLALMAILFPFQISFVAYAPFFRTERLLGRWPLTRIAPRLSPPAEAAPPVTDRPG